MVKDIHGHISQEADVKQIHSIFDDWGVDEAVNMVDFIEIDPQKVIRQAEASGRICPVIMMPPQLRKGAEYLEKCIKTGFKGLKLHSQIHGFRYMIPRYSQLSEKPKTLASQYLYTRDLPGQEGHTTRICRLLRPFHMSFLM